MQPGGQRALAAGRQGGRGKTRKLPSKTAGNVVCSGRQVTRCRPPSLRSCHDAVAKHGQGFLCSLHSPRKPKPKKKGAPCGAPQVFGEERLVVNCFAVQVDVETFDL